MFNKKIGKNVSFIISPFRPLPQLRIANVQLKDQTIRLRLTAKLPQAGTYLGPFGNTAVPLSADTPHLVPHSCPSAFFPVSRRMHSEKLLQANHWAGRLICSIINLPTYVYRATTMPQCLGLKARY